MVKKKLDWKNPSGIVYFAFLKEFFDTEWDLLGPYKDVTQPPRVNPPILLNHLSRVHSTSIVSG